MLEVIQNLCKDRDISIFKLEKELGFGNGTIYKWEKSSPAVDKLKKVADYFGVTVDYILAAESIKKLPKFLKPVSQLESEFARYGLRVDIDDGPFFKTVLISHNVYGEIANMSVAEFHENGEFLLSDLIKEFELKYEPETIAAHHDGEGWTEVELETIRKFKEFVKSQRKSQE
ncbi:helix-turn-helix transcriptional regulator [Paenibacillus alvei]|uniref:Helix-turn-helix transcriptional regulator n=1 Tax=Paenibacillus alvei TaxID=44250 RepID=A0ABT4H1Q5_PAEAL|nr:helix-turn-helix transcriptional regulator [Paenibacillus alvei]EJW19195.1 helix-turn-helix domain protein [Paenibacillus alvei DSM 29]MCY9542662.1 helix-turn-helix transcriptional regulator [Paenibacillus alvei]MCY9704932.1 helix-turn-helix transcriptional regulator [Paenibacillus alvei]MCY9735791.1 helix-turn-helix transcriptional regulator [Paenibacillus alvei]MCY9756846.1 helix-turn-helix transcriptional regulator [Paenibacillus alvei]